MSSINFYTLHSLIRVNCDLLAIERYKIENQQIVLFFSHADKDNISVTRAKLNTRREINPNAFAEYKKAIQFNLNYLRNEEFSMQQVKAVESILICWQEYLTASKPILKSKAAKGYLDKLVSAVQRKDIQSLLDLDLTGSCPPLTILECSHFSRLMHCAVHLLICSGKHIDLRMKDIIPVAKAYISHTYVLQGDKVYLDLSGKLCEVCVRHLINVIYRNALHQEQEFSLQMGTC